MILPPATLGMLGGGQLGRYFVIAAQQLGYRVMVLDPDRNSPAARIADLHIAAPYDDREALSRMAKSNMQMASRMCLTPIFVLKVTFQTPRRISSPAF